MNQDKIAKFIKDARTKDKLSQEKFGEKYGVTYQAVSKWENAKNIPDISILKEICKDYNKDINELLNDKKIFKKYNYKIFLMIITFLVLIIISLCVIIFMAKKENANNDNFQFKTIKTTCDNFELSGSIAYDNSKTSIYISNITYCGKENLTKYKEIECIFYEVDGTTKNEIDSYNDNNITLEEFLKKVKFNVDHYSTTCKMYKENALFLEIKATDEEQETAFYSIPLVLEENCK